MSRHKSIPKIVAIAIEVNGITKYVCSYQTTLRETIIPEYSADPDKAYDFKTGSDAIAMASIIEDPINNEFIVTALDKPE